jgi:hypothetical protein
MPLERITEAWRFCHEHRENVAGYRNRADGRQGIIGASLLVFCGGVRRETPFGRMDIGCRSVGAMANWHRKSNLGGIVQIAGFQSSL